MTGSLDLADLERLYSVLTTAEREELLQSILIAVSRGEHEVTRMLEAYCLAYAGSELIADSAGPSMGASSVSTQSERSSDKE